MMKDWHNLHMKLPNGKHFF